MSELHHRPYFFTPFQSDSDHPLFVSLPGMDETGKELMTLQTAGLQARFDVRCFVIPADSLESWDALSQQAIALTNAELEKAPRQVYLCGESFGTCIALTILAQAASLWERIILINSASSFHRVSWMTFGSFLLPWTPIFLYNFPSILALPFLAQLSRLPPAARKALMKSAQDAPKQAAEQRLKLLRKFKMNETKLQKIAQPVLLIGSQQDHLLPSVKEARRLAKIFPNSRVIVLPDSGHACLIESNTKLMTILQSNNFLPL